MKIRNIWGNLVVKDLDKTQKFYTDLGFRQNGQPDEGRLISFSFAESNFIINFFTEKGFAKGLTADFADATKETEIMFSLSADSREEVDQWHEKVQSIGGTIVGAPQNVGEGYTFSFADPDGHKYNFLYWPGM
ncbi:glyoxalase [Pedobacter sp. HMF7647]|uniref:Glyoxalase n=1 Tax=Hufsiella arboris TaxID=2695275 RepID=A0A7K1Y9W4_9SPHI|nr:VOC family protein [Hufsiella arboris]MXV51377.1 glyoxalase [Hufsiella arboris]